MSENPRKSRFRASLRVRTPEPMGVAVARAANNSMTTSSEYVRQAILDRLRADGLLDNSSAEIATV
jgi:hypothetical protein